MEAADLKLKVQALMSLSECGRGLNRVGSEVRGVLSSEGFDSLLKSEEKTIVLHECGSEVSGVIDLWAVGESSL